MSAPADGAVEAYLEAVGRHVRLRLVLLGLPAQIAEHEQQLDRLWKLTNALPVQIAEAAELVRQVEEELGLAQADVAPAPATAEPEPASEAPTEPAISEGPGSTTPGNGTPPEPEPAPGANGANARDGQEGGDGGDDANGSRAEALVGVIADVAGVEPAELAPRRRTGPGRPPDPDSLSGRIRALLPNTIDGICFRLDEEPRRVRDALRHLQNIGSVEQIPDTDPPRFKLAEGIAA